MKSCNLVINNQTAGIYLYYLLLKGTPTDLADQLKKEKYFTAYISMIFWSLTSTLAGSILPRDDVGNQLSELNIKHLVKYGIKTS